VKYLGYVMRNVRRNPIRTLLTVASISVCLFLMMVLTSLFSVTDDVARSLRDSGRLITMSSQGFAQAVPYSDVNSIAGMDGVATVGELTPWDKENKDKKAVTPWQFYGGTYKDSSVMEAQFGVDQASAFAILDEFSFDPEQIKAFRSRPDGCIVGRKLANERKIKLGDSYPLKSQFYNYNLDLTVVGFYDCPPDRDGRTVFFRWDYLDEGLKSSPQGKGQSGNAGTIYFKCKPGTSMASMAKAVDDSFRNSEKPTKTQTDEAFTQMFNEMVGDLQAYINWVGIAVTASLICCCAVAMAMAMRERTNEIAVLKAIGFSRGLVLCLVLSESMLLALMGGLIGAMGTKVLFDYFDLSTLAPAFLPFFYVPIKTALMGLAGAILVGFLAGVIPAVLAARLPVIQGLRKVV
jgi:putative ABC transport system permease protein